MDNSEPKLRVLPSNPCFFRFPRFCRFAVFPFFFLCISALSSKDFKGSAERTILAFFLGVPLFCPPQKKQGLEGQGRHGRFGTRIEGFDSWH